MPTATDLQVQTFVDERFRRRAEQIRALVYSMSDDKAAIDDVYAALTQQNPTWSDQRGGGVPHLLSPSDALALNTFVTDALAAMTGHAQYPIVLKACVRPIEVIA